MGPVELDIFHMVINASLMVQFVLVLLLFFFHLFLGNYCYQVSIYSTGHQRIRSVYGFFLAEP